MMVRALSVLQSTPVFLFTLRRGFTDPINIEIALINPHASLECNCRQCCTVTHQKCIVTLITVGLFSSGRFHEISYFEHFQFTLCCGWKEE